MERDGHRDTGRSGDSGSGAGGKRRCGADDDTDDADHGADRGERDEHDDAEEQQDTKKKVKRKRKSGEHGASPDAGRLSRKEAVPHIKRWLREHVVEREEGSLLKRELFEAYLRFCMQSNLNPTNDATFGRMVNAVFPNVQQRRLRRDSHIKKWHYCGIAYRSGGGALSPPISAAATTHTATSVVGSPFTTTTTTSTTSTSDASLATFSSASAYHPSPPHSNYPPHHHPPPAYRHGYPPPPPSYYSSLGPPPPLYTPSYPDQAYRAPTSAPTHAYGAPLPAYAPHHHPASSYVGRFHSRLLPVPVPLDELTTVPPYHHPSAQPPRLPSTSEPYGGLPPAPAFSRVEGQLARVYSHSNSYSPAPDESGPGKGKALTDRHEIGNGLTATSGSPPSMWLRNVDNSLPFLNQLHLYASFYRREMWGFEPLNPLCMKTDTLRYLFMTEEGSKERSPLSLCTHYALCAGALLSGHFAQAKEHFAAAREHLGYVFDSSNYDVACTLCYITSVARFFAQNEREGKELSQYYLTLGMETCENIGAQNDDLYTMLVKSCAIYLHRIDEEASTLLQAKSVPRWRKPWKQGKYYVEQYKYGKFVSALQECAVETLKQLVVLLLRPPHQPPTPEEWWTLREASEWREGAITGLEQLYLYDPPRQLTTFLRAYVIFARAVCNLRLNLVDDTQQASSDFLQLLSRCNRGVVACVFSDLWWTGACAEAFVGLVVFLHREGRRDLVNLALALLALVKSDLVWADQMHGRLVALNIVPTTTDDGGCEGEGGGIPIKQEKEELLRSGDNAHDLNSLGYLGHHKLKATVEEDGSAQLIGTASATRQAKAQKNKM